MNRTTEIMCQWFVFLLKQTNVSHYYFPLILLNSPRCSIIARFLPQNSFWTDKWSSGSYGVPYKYILKGTCHSPWQDTNFPQPTYFLQSTSEMKNRDPLDHRLWKNILALEKSVPNTTIVFLTVFFFLFFFFLY